MKQGDIILITFFMVVFVLLVSILGSRRASTPSGSGEEIESTSPKTNSIPEPASQVDSAHAVDAERALLLAVVANRSERGYPWDLVVIHHSGAEHGDAGAIERAPHVPHFVIGNGQGMKQGEVAATSLWRRQEPGTHAGDEAIDARAIGITLIGRFDRADPPPLQLDVAADLVDTLVSQLGLERSQVFGHSDLPGAATACPGRIPVQWVAGTGR